MQPFKDTIEGIIPIHKPKGISAFSLVRLLRKHLGVKKIGHAGTLDPFATGVMVLLVGRNFTRLSDSLLNQDKEYVGRIKLGQTTDTYDCEGCITSQSDMIPTLEEIEEALKHFQGEVQQIPPMYSAKKQNGKKLYELARKGQTVERKAATVRLHTELVAYSYPHIDIRVNCSKGTYIRSLAHDIGTLLGCGAHLASLTRTRSGSFQLKHCFDGERLQEGAINQSELIQALLPAPQAI